MSKRHEAYLYHVNFNAMHNLVLDNPKKMHAHTFRVGMYVIKELEDNPAFLSTEKILNQYFTKYQGVRLNEISSFKDVIPTIENMGEVFYWELKPIFAENGMKLLFLEVGDSPISNYCVGEQLMLGNVYNIAPEDVLDAYCERVRQKYNQMAIGENE